jgi:hypothetical protein
MYLSNGYHSLIPIIIGMGWYHAVQMLEKKYVTR